MARRRGATISLGLQLVDGILKGQLSADIDRSGYYSLASYAELKKQ